MMEDFVNKLRMYADDLHSAGGFNGYASAMSLAADEIVKLREYAAVLEADLIATIDEENGLTLHGDIEFFVHLVAEREREACAKLVFNSPPSDEYESPLLAVYNAIRARGIKNEN